MSAQRRQCYQVIWRIENIRSWLQAREDYLYSPQFIAETLTNTRWKLRLSPNWQLAEKYISITLQRDIDDEPTIVDLNYEISLLSSDGSPFKSKIFMKKFRSKTFGLELNVEQCIVLNSQNEAYLPEGVLTVCCKMWKWSTVSQWGQCSIQSAIGTKRINMDVKVNHFVFPCSRLIDFVIPSADVSRISLIIFVAQKEFIFRKKDVECKPVSWYSIKLYAVDNWGRKTEFDDATDLSEPVTAKSSTVLEHVSYCGFFGKYIPNNTLTLHLSLIYHPAIVSESVKREFISLNADLVNLKRFNSEIGASESSESSDEEEESTGEDECLNTTEKRSLPSTTLKEDLLSLFNDRLFCDTNLRTDTETLPAHRSVLSARSSVFKKMFTTDMKEKAGESVVISDISSDTVRRMLQFLYTDCTGDLNMQIAKDLYIASDKYDITSLKERCVSFIQSNLSKSNVCEILVLADMHHDKHLEHAAQQFVLTYDKEVYCSNEWKLFMKNYSNLAAQVMYLKCIGE